MQKLTIYSIVSFLSGAAVSGLATWFVAKKKYEKIAQDEIDSVKEHFTVPKTLKKESVEEIKKKSENVLANKAKNKPDIMEYEKQLKDNKYVNYSKSPEEKSVAARYPWEKMSENIKKINLSNVPYVISPDEYGDEEDYDRVDLTLYADGILADEDDRIVEASEVIGEGNIDRMGEFEDDALHVCDPMKKIYYEILSDERSYQDATGKEPHPDDEED